jgi:hypothetical protein
MKTAIISTEQSSEQRQKTPSVSKQQAHRPAKNQQFSVALYFPQDSPLNKILFK